MRSRKQIDELFSTFVQFRNDRESDWYMDVKLHRNMQRCLEQSPETLISEFFWSLYWYKLWQTQSSNLAIAHLFAYLQEPCYWAAHHALRRFSTIQCTLRECFQIAIAEVDTLLQQFNPDRGASLKTYAGIAFPSLLRDRLQQRHEAALCKNWTLLRKVSRKRFVEALCQAGFSAEAIAQYRLAWTCFLTVYVPATPSAKLPQLDSGLWEAIATRYNAERQTVLISAKANCSPSEIERWLTRCAERVRAYSYPPIESLNAPVRGQESGELQDTLPDLLSESLLTELIAQEDTQTRQTRNAEINSVLNHALEQLNTESQTVLELYYKQNLSQQQIAQHLKLSQPTIGRRLSKARELLLFALAAWSENTLNISLTPTLIKEMSATLDEWLRVQYDGLR